MSFEIAVIILLIVILSLLTLSLLYLFWGRRIPGGPRVVGRLDPRPTSEPDTTRLPSTTVIDPREPEEIDGAAIEAQFVALSTYSQIKRENLQILAEREVQLPLTERSFIDFKVLDVESGRSTRIALAEDDRKIDPDELLRTEQAERFQRFGRMQQALHSAVERMEQSQGGGVIPVLIKYAIEDPGDGIGRPEIGTLDEGAIKELDQRAEAHQQQLHDRVLTLHNQTIRQIDAPQIARIDGDARSSGPFVSAELDPGAIRRLAQADQVAFVGLDNEPDVLDYPTIPESLPTTRTNTVHASGITGDGIKIVVLESGSLWKDEACFNIAEIQDTSAAVNSHMTKSVGIIGNRYKDGKCDGDWEGYAPGADVYIANVTDYTDRYDWARARGVNVVTMSWHKSSEETDGDLHSRDIYFDYWALRWPYPSVFTSAGNGAGSGDYSSGKGYNFIGVGDVLNDGDGDRCNDTMADSSSWKNPTSPHNDREIPEIASPGSRHALLGSSFGGTSCATPVTASIAALLMSKNKSLKIWPEAIRPILQVTANYQNADGANFASWSDGKDGTGMTNALYALWTASTRETSNTAQFRAHDYGTMTADDFDGGFFEKTWKAKVSHTRSRIRVAIAWNSKVSAEDGDPVSSVLDADLDLWVHDPDGTLVAWSGSWDSSYEFVEFTPPRAGEYEIKIRGFSVPKDFRSWYGVAWTAHYDLCSRSALGNNTFAAP